MNPILRKYLESIGLKASASDADAERYLASLTGAEAEIARTLTAPQAADPPPPPDEDEEEEEEEDKKAEEATEEKPEDEEEKQDTAQRTVEILAVAQRYGMGLDWARRQIETGATLQQAKDEIMQKLNKDKAPLSISVGEDLNRSTLGIACADAMLAGVLERFHLGLSEDDGEGKVVARKPHPRAKAFAGKAPTEICRDFLAAQGVPVEGLHRNQIARMVFDRNVMATHATGDFPYLLANVLNKALTRQYQEMQPQWPLFCVRGVIPDFKQVNRVSFGEVPNLATVVEGAEYTQFTIGERREVYTLVKSGKKFALTWEAIVNDDLSAFARIPGQMITAARRLEDASAFGQLTGTSTMGDGNALFDATNHSNLATTTADKGAPTVARLNSARTAMATQTGISSDVKLNLVPSFILAPHALAGTIDELLTSQSNPASSNAGVSNIWNGRLTPIYNALLDASSATAWYLACGPALIDTIEVGFLAGYESPTMETIDGTSPDKREYFIRHICAAKALDWRGLYKNPGA